MSYVVKPLRPQCKGEMLLLKIYFIENKINKFNLILHFVLLTGLFDIALHLTASYSLPDY